MSFRSVRSASDTFQPPFDNTNIRVSQMPYNALSDFPINNAPQFRFQNNFRNTRAMLTPNNNFAGSTVCSSVIPNIEPQPPPPDIYNVCETNSRLIPSNYEVNNQFFPRLPTINSPLSYGSGNNSGQPFHNFPPPPVRFLRPQRFSEPSLHQQSQVLVRRDRPVLQIPHRQMNVINQHQQNISRHNFTYHGHNASLKSNFPITSNSQDVSDLYQTKNSSLSDVSNSLPRCSESALNVLDNVNNLNFISTSINTSHPLTTICTNSMTVPCANSNSTILHPVIPMAIRVPPPSIPSGIPMHIPPPSYSKLENSMCVPFLSTIQTDGCDKESKLEQYIAKFTATQKKKTCFKLPIPEFRSTLTAAFHISKELHTRKQKLHDLLHSDKESWNSEMLQISNLKSKLSELCSFLSHPLHLNNIMKKLQLIKKRREQKRKTKCNKKSAKKKAEQNRKEHHQEIDKWLDDIKEKNLKLKREAEMKKEADNILLEVRKKIHEANRTVEKIKVFEKLRNVRKDNAVKKGLHITSEHDENFEKKISILKEMMSRQLVDYEAEEKALKVMLETEQEGQLEEEAQWKLKKAKALQQKKQRHIVECLFGNSEDPLPTDPLYLFHKYHISAYSNIENLIQIRHQWDAHIAEDGECIPQQWVIPTAPSNSSWEQHLITATGASKS